MTINEAMIYQKQLQARHTELVALRNENSAATTRYYGAHADKEITKQPLYDVVALDTLVSEIAKEMRLLEMAIKATNATTPVAGFTANDAVMRPITAAAK